MRVENSSPGINPVVPGRKPIGAKNRPVFVGGIAPAG
jgi:hypothetical protein